MYKAPAFMTFGRGGSVIDILAHLLLHLFLIFIMKTFCSLSLSLSLTHTHTHSWVRNWHYLTCRYIWFLFLCETVLLSLSHMDIYFYRSSVWSWWWIDDDKHVNTWICKCVVDLCMKIILDRCLCFLCLSFFDSRYLRFNIHNFWKNHLDIVLVLNCEELVELY